ncbi:MAG: hypothetical protein KJO29_03425 [Bacteroidia bacterium]|nr:hypothetical protein [Bacteroidia bacterium]
MSNEIALERQHKRKGARISLFFHIALIIIALFAKCDYEKAIENQYAVAINFEEIEFKPSANSNKAQSTSGEARKKADPVSELETKKSEPIETKPPEVKQPTPTPTPPQPTDPVIAEETMEDSEVEAVEEVLDVEDPEPEPVPEPEPEPEVIPEPEPEPAPEETTKESIKDKIDRLKDIFKTGGGKKSDNPEGDPSRSEGTDEGTGEGKEGKGQGADKTGNDGDSGVGTGGSGLGEYDDSGDGVFGRRVIYRNVGQIPMTMSGTVVVKVCINRAGLVTYVELLERESTITDQNILRKTAKAAQGYKFEPDRTAPREQCGKLKISLDINALKISEG